ncbi:MAG: 50S ribosomal protein L24 [Hyphomonadaceae bacterium]
MPAKIKKGDTVIVIAGKDKGKSGRVLEVRPSDERVVVDGVNLVKRHLRPSMADPQGGVKTQPAAIHISNVAMRDPKSGEATRVGFKTLDDGRKVRIAKRSGVEIDV